MKTHFLPARDPFDFSLSLQFLNGFLPGQGELKVSGAELRRAARVDGQAVGVALRAAEGGVEAELYPEKALSEQQTGALLTRLSDFLSLDADTEPFLHLAGQDAAFASRAVRLRGFHPPRFLTPFEAACWAILSQRARMPLARAVKRQLSLDLGGMWEGLPAFPEPADLLKLSEAEAVERLGNERRGKALLAVAAAFAQVNSQWLRTAPSTEIGEWLRGIKGVGEWSAQLVLIRGLGRVETLIPAHGGPLEKELLKAALPVYGELTPGELWARAGHYGDCSGLWATALRGMSGPEA